MLCSALDFSALLAVKVEVFAASLCCDMLYDALLQLPTAGLAE